MGLYEGRGNLAKSFKDLQLRWQATKQDWHDQVADEFDKAYLDPIEQALRNAISAMDQMAQVISRVDRDCK